MTFFATPALIYPGQDPEQFAAEVERMITRAKITAAWERGEIDTITFMDAMDELGVDIIQAAEDWSSGIRYI